MAVKVQKITGPLNRASVKKNVAAIHISGKLTLLQRKLSNVLLLNAYDHMLDKRSHMIDASTLSTMIGYNSHDTETLKESLRGLAETVAEWDMLNEKGKQEWGVSSLLSFAKLSEGVCEYAYSPALAEKLYDPKIFALINLDIQKRFSSGHGLALYENCYRFKNTGSTGWWELDVFRRLMGVDESAYYQKFKHLNAKIIKPAVAEVNKTSDIEIEPEYRKLGRAISHIRFVIKENSQLPMFNLDDGEGVRKSPLYVALRDKGVSDRLAKSWLKEHGEDYVGAKLAYVESRAGEGHVKGSQVPYLTAAIRDDYVEVEKPAPSVADIAARVALKQVAQKDEEDRAFRLAQKRERNEKLEVVLAHVARQSPTRRSTDRSAFLSSLGTDEIARAHFERDGWNSVLNASAIISYFEDRAPEIFNS